MLKHTCEYGGSSVIEPAHFCALGVLAWWLESVLPVPLPRVISV
jgi:hypothetical protein